MALINSLWSFFLFTLFNFLLVDAAPSDQKTVRHQLKKDGDSCCTTLSRFLPGKVHDSTNPNYAASQLSFWSAQEQSLKPSCIVIPTSTQDVSTAVSILNAAHQASIQGCKFAIRSAGHTPQGGAANIDGGVTIDLQSLNAVTLSSDQKTVGIGSGNRWGNVYGQLDALNLTVVGGRLTSVGVGGLLTGGGMSFFSPRYGFAADNLVAIEVVLADGRVVVATSKQYPDLFRALKGGNNNFGIVTRFDAKVYPGGNFWAGTLVQPSTVKADLFAWFSTFAASKNYDPYAALITNIAWTMGQAVISHNVAYTTANTAWPPPVYQPLDALPKLLSTIRPDNLTAHTGEIAASSVSTNSQNNLFLTTTFANRDPAISTAHLSALYDLTDAVVREFALIPGFLLTLTFQPLPHILYSRSAGTAGNVLGLDRCTEDYIMVLNTASWADAAHSAQIEARLQKLEADVVALQTDEGIHAEFVYLNYAAAWQDPIAGYGDANGRFLRGVSARFDRGGLFQRGVPGGFKLG